MNYKKIVEVAFRKAREEYGDISLNALSDKLSDKSDTLKLRLSPRTFFRNYEEFVLNNENKKMRNDTLEFYYRYLEVENYSEFLEKYDDAVNQNTEVEENETKNKNKYSFDKPENSIHVNIHQQQYFGNYLIVILLAVTLLLVLYYVFTTKNKTFIENFHVDNQYFYKIDENGQYKIFENKDRPADSYPLEPKIFDAYFYQNGIDTTKKEVKIVKAQYFQNQIKIEDLPYIEASHSNIGTVKKSEFNSKSTFFNIQYNDSLDKSLYTIFQQVLSHKYLFTNEKNSNYLWICNGNISYDFSKNSLVEKGYVCKINLYYYFQNTKTKESLFQNTCSANGVGFSETEAKNNALSKLKLLLK